MRLRRNQLCPIHRSQGCCGRESAPKEKRLRQMGVRRIDDPHHPRGYREIRSNGEMRKLEHFHHSCTQLRVSLNHACAFSADIS